MIWALYKQTFLDTAKSDSEPFGLACVHRANQIQVLIQDRANRIPAFRATPHSESLAPDAPLRISCDALFTHPHGRRSLEVEGTGGLAKILCLAVAHTQLNCGCGGTLQVSDLVVVSLATTLRPWQDFTNSRSVDPRSVE